MSLPELLPVGSMDEDGAMEANNRVDKEDEREVGCFERLLEEQLNGVGRFRLFRTGFTT